ncbi:ATP synthase F1 subunit gamma [Schwartzia succinivorans]|uniref:ATP synthase gamma chain n=1 Tax=Schwartzia succinivorans DSM 10502 TaxID=1123243 RepID=A0A1M4XH72_9FIRM|nr:ATP synthase F1 subunit gamma [Schwartzia succinivorans]MBQ1917808.1 ATP synthase F1 subunit gamma [Schwartzia sp. (in: firmicutes)]MBQ3862554.1 ATP synthase F1 subunit gamma [Schwartzia sp. (in: firmicutes)]SHE92904.1 F-type H+-transporting ATPase subunit gamma [Schwartzia succinivorans DSM 10502]
MASLQDIRRRIKSVKSIQQITKAMKMVAAARLRRAQMAAIANKPYANKMAEVVESVAANVGDFKHPLLESHPGGKELFLIVASDKGLAGAYASNVFKEAVSHIPDKSAADLITIGRKTEEHFRNRNYNIVKSYMGISERPTFDDAKAIAKDITERYESGEYSVVHIVYTRFVSAISSVPETFQLLPFEGLVGDNTKAEENSEEENFGEESLLDSKSDDDYMDDDKYIFEPNAEEVLGYLLPQYLVTMIYAAQLQAAASELSSRMTAMSNATDNAEELNKKLDLQYNKVRQANITREISEIVGGAEALK